MRKIYSLLILLFFNFTVQSQTDFYIGANSGTNTGSIYPAPLQDYWEGSRAQYLYTASELQTAGMAVGNIFGIKINVTNLNGVAIIENYTISIGTTTTTSLSASTWETLNGSSGPVFGPVNYTPVLGINEFSFPSPFYWNGSDNIVVEICNGDANTTSGTFWSDNALSPWTTGLSFNGSHTYAADNLDNLCGSATTTNRGDQTTRPDITFTWNSANVCTAPPTAGIANASVTTACSGVPFTLSLSGSSIGTGLTYQWDSSANGTTWFPMPGDTTSTVSQAQISSSYYRCRVTCSGNTQNSSPTLLIETPPLVKGSFTINAGQPSGGGNFQSITEAINSISCGIDSTVVFNILPGSGPYMEQVIIPVINGASSTNRVIINGNGESLNYTATGTADRAGLILNGADFITIDSLNVDVSSGSSHGWGVVLTNQADSNIIRRCTITTSTSSNSSNYSGIIINGSATGTASQGNNGNGNLIEKNKIVGGYYGVYMYGSSSSNNENNQIIN
ncbi:MAG: hypothetical protein KGZ59_03130, partial [Chitinophagaceae bacterium]|nr:hypothetical protein [Chitinophagaceae bacterium]